MHAYTDNNLPWKVKWCGLQKKQDVIYLKLEQRFASFTDALLFSPSVDSTHSLKGQLTKYIKRSGKLGDLLRKQLKYNKTLYCEINSIYFQQGLLN